MLSTYSTFNFIGLVVKFQHTWAISSHNSCTMADFSSFWISFFKISCPAKASSLTVIVFFLTFSYCEQVITIYFTACQLVTVLFIRIVIKTRQSRMADTGQHQFGYPKPKAKQFWNTKKKMRTPMTRQRIAMISAITCKMYQCFTPWGVKYCSQCDWPYVCLSGHIKAQQLLR